MIISEKYRSKNKYNFKHIYSFVSKSVGIKQQYNPQQKSRS